MFALFGGSGAAGATLLLLIVVLTGAFVGGAGPDRNNAEAADVTRLMVDVNAPFSSSG